MAEICKKLLVAACIILSYLSHEHDMRCRGLAALYTIHAKCQFTILQDCYAFNGKKEIL